MKSGRVSPTALCILLAMPALARAQDLAGRLSLAVQGGTQLELAGEATTAVDGTLLGRVARLAATPYDDIYRPRVRLQAQLAYGVSPNVELIARVSRYTSRVASVDTGVAAGGPLLLCFESADGDPGEACGGPQVSEYGLELGARFTIAPHSRLKSYLGLVAGVRHSEQLLVSLRLPASASAVLHVPFVPAETVPVFGLDLGFTVDLTERLFLGLESGVRFQPGRTRDDVLPELGSFQNGGARFTTPVLATLGVRL